MSHSSDSFQNNYSQNKYKQNTLTLITNALLAQVVEHWSCKPEVLGSTPKGGIFQFDSQRGQIFYSIQQCIE